ncbi:MAG: ParM/StbA family protein [Nanoarchaeota archaeon]|nr:ParM/StbA family protein [Nanoarchaeota archaeon]
MKEINMICGNDNGNSEHDLVINGRFVGQPNVFAKMTQLPMLEELNPEYIAKNIHDKLIVSIKSKSCPVGTYAIGNFALGSGNRIHNMDVGLLNDKTNSDIVIVNTFGQLAGYAAAKAYLEDSTVREVHAFVDLTTELPVTQYNKQNATVLKNKMMGSHDISVYLGSVEIKVKLEIEYVKVLPESVSAIFYLQNGPKELYSEFAKEVDGSYFKDKRAIHAGIGEGTSEYPITNGIAFDPNFIKGSDNGVGLAIDKARIKLANSVSLRNLSRQDYSKYLKDSNHKYHSFAMDFIEDPIDEEASAILFNVKEQIERSNNEADFIFVHGGGSIMMRGHLENKLKALCQKTLMELFYVPTHYAVALEALGLYEFCNSEIYASLKENATGKPVLKIDIEETVLPDVIDYSLNAEIQTA